MKKIVVLSGAGISAESGIQTFRGINGLWEGHRIEDVASPEGWQRNPEMVQRFYNLRRKSVVNAQPNAGHMALVELEKHFDVIIITQNIDDLHERAGSSHILHLHGEITKSQSSVNPNLVFDIDGDEISMGALCPLGSQLRPHVVWFGEAVPNLRQASRFVEQADILIIVGTSLQVYPAAGLIDYVKQDCEIHVIDPNAANLGVKKAVTFISDNAANALPILVKNLTK